MVRGPGHLSANLDGDIVLMHGDNGRYFMLDTIGSRIWELLGEPIAVSTVLESLGQEYETGGTDHEDDTLAFLQELLDADLAQLDPH